MDKLRLHFRKEGRAVYLSHLDLMHTFQRAFSRAGYSLKYSEGYNPHPVISIAMPLSVGTASECEILDFSLTRECDLNDMPARLTASLPEGVTVCEAYRAEKKPSEIRWLKADGIFRYDSEPDVEAVRSFFAQNEIVISKKTKRGVAETDIVPGIKSFSAEPIPGTNDISIECTVSAQEPTLNPDLLAEALRQKAPKLCPAYFAFRRIEIYDAEMRPFR